MEFNPANNIVRLCLQGMQMEEAGKPEMAYDLFQQAWKTASGDFEKFIAAFYLARHQNEKSEEIKWLETALHFAQQVNDNSVEESYRFLYLKIAQCHEALGHLDAAKKSRDLAVSFNTIPSDAGPFYHGTKAQLEIGNLLIPGKQSNYKADLLMNHIYFSALVNAAGLAAALANGDGPERIYVIEPTGDFESDPNVTNKKFPGNPTRSYRTRHPLKIVGEIRDWVRVSPEEIQRWREKLSENKGDIIN